MTEAFPCTEQGIRDAIAEGGGPHKFACNGPRTVVTEAEIVIDNDVILDGEGNLTVDGDEDHRVFSLVADMTSELRGLTVSHGSVLGEFFPQNTGGGIFNEGTLTLTNSTVSGNTGGGILNVGTLALTNSTVSGNSDSSNPGILNRGTLTLTNSTVSGNGLGGVVNSRTLTLTDSTVSGNSGRGIYNYGAETTLTLTNSTVSDNANHSGDGGGIANSATLTVSNSTVSGNSADFGGGITNYGALTLTNSTVSSNSAVVYGGGIYNYQGTLTLTNSTVSGNSVRSGGGGGIHNEGTLTLTNTLVDNDCVDATAISGGHNVESPGDTCGFDQTGDQVNVTAGQLNLGPLADNGGPTMTHALGAGSIAIDRIPEAECRATEDQRGEPRPAGSGCDVGAFEVQP
jgi:hypothetical protein